MKQILPIAAALALFGLGAVAVHAQETGQTVSDTNAVFDAMRPDSNGTVADKITHAPAGDVLALYIGRMPKQMYSKQDDLLYIVSGFGTASVGYPTFDIKAGSVVSIPRNTAFEIRAHGNQMIKAILIASPSDNPDDKHIL